MTDAFMIPVGERIRTLRQERGLSQKALAGEHMTRNMLSLIENGQATPSLATILYLAETLKVPAGYFFTSSTEDGNWYRKMMRFPKIKELYAAGRFSECELSIREISEYDFDDETAYISAQCCYHLAMQCASGYALNSALTYLEKAANAVQDTIYAGDDLKHAIAYYRNLISLLLSMDNDLKKAGDLHNASALVPLAMLEYFKAVSTSTLSPLVLTDEALVSVHGRHLYALSLMESNGMDRALPILNTLLEDPTLPFYMRYQVCSNLEACADAVGDFRAAYAAAKKRLELMECAKK